VLWIIAPTPQSKNAQEKLSKAYSRNSFFPLEYRDPTLLRGDPCHNYDEQRKTMALTEPLLVSDTTTLCSLVQSSVLYPPNLSRYLIWRSTKNDCIYKKAIGSSSCFKRLQLSLGHLCRMWHRPIANRHCNTTNLSELPTTFFLKKSMCGSVGNFSDSKLARICCLTVRDNHEFLQPCLVSNKPKYPCVLVSYQRMRKGARHSPLYGQPQLRRRTRSRSPLRWPLPAVTTPAATRRSNLERGGASVGARKRARSSTSPPRSLPCGPSRGLEPDRRRPSWRSWSGPTTMLPRTPLCIFPSCVRVYVASTRRSSFVCYVRINNGGYELHVSSQDRLVVDRNLQKLMPKRCIVSNDSRWRKKDVIPNKRTIFSMRAR
jgi:hypothetical protein